MKISKKHRQEYIFSLLKYCDQESALSVADIIERLKSDSITATARTIRRDIEELSLHHGVCETDSYPACFYLSENYGLKRELLIKEETLCTLMIALDYFKNTAHNYFYEYAQESQEMILNALPKKMANELLNLKQFFDYSYSSAGKEQGDHKESFRLIFKALKEYRVIHCLNHSPYKDETYNNQIRTFLPLKINLSSHIPYLMVKDMEDNKIKRIRITRLSNIELTDQIDMASSKLKLDFGNSFGGYGGSSEEVIEVLIYGDKLVGTYFSEKRIHPSQQVEKISNDEYRIFFKTLLSSELIRLLSSFGGHLNTIQPFEVWEKVQNIWKEGLKKAG